MDKWEARWRRNKLEKLVLNLKLKAMFHRSLDPELSNLFGFCDKNLTTSTCKDADMPTTTKKVGGEEGSLQPDILGATRVWAILLVPQWLTLFPWAKKQPCMPSKTVWHAAVWYTSQGLSTFARNQSYRSLWCSCFSAWGKLSDRSLGGRAWLLLAADLGCAWS